MDWFSVFIGVLVGMLSSAILVLATRNTVNVQVVNDDEHDDDADFWKKNKDEEE